MSKIMLVNVTHVEESRVAVLDDGVLAAYDIETLNRTNIKGNIHNAVVESVHPSLEAAFVKIGPDLKGFLPLDEVNFRLLPARTDSRKLGRIGQHLHPGQKIMAQVVREPFAGKPPTISTYFSLPGRFLVLMPGVDSSGVSRKIESSSQRDRLRKIIEELQPPEGFGLIVRTAGLGQTKTELQRDLRYLLRLWESIQRASSGAEFPSLVYREADLVIRTMRDHLSPDIEEVWVDSKETYEKALEFVGDVMPKRSKTLKLYTGDRPLFNKFNLEEQIERIYKRRVPLPSGGEIVIDGTEALTAVDVNTARSKRSGDLEDSATITNCEAAQEIARQLRLRDLGGLIVIDFIDMAKTSNKKRVEKTMRDALRGDKAKSDATVISKLGLMELARQRLKGAKMAASYATCPTCDGHGLIKNVEAAALSLFRKLQSRGTAGNVGRIRASMEPEVATWLLNQKRDELSFLERRQGIGIEIVPDAAMLRHESKFESFPREPGSPAPVPVPDESQGAQATQASQPDESAEGPSETETSPAAPTPRRRRGRGGRGRSAASESPATSNGSGEKEAAAAPAEPREGSVEEETDSGPRPRRRRRSRRRGKPADGEAGDAPAAASAGNAPSGPPAAPQAAPPAGNESQPPREVVVPRGVRADELMPAAIGRAKEKGRRSDSGGSGSGGASGGPRRRRKSSSRRS